MMGVRLSRAACLFPVLLACIGSDQLTKWLAARYLAPAGSLSFFYDTLRLSYVENSGGFLGLLGGLPEKIRFLLLTCGVRTGTNLIASLPTIMVDAYQVKRRVYDKQSMFFHMPIPGQSTAEHILATYRPGEPRPEAG